MKKFLNGLLTITMIFVFTIALTGCDKKENNNGSFTGGNNNEHEQSDNTSSSLTTVDG